MSYNTDNQEKEHNTEENVKKIDLVPAVCTQCGATLEVDPNQEAAVCKFCNTPFIVSKAINNYTIQHADHVTVDLKGSVDSVLNFADKQLDKGREERKEKRLIENEKTKTIVKSMWKFILIALVIDGVIWLIATALHLW